MSFASAELAQLGPPNALHPRFLGPPIDSPRVEWDPEVEAASCRFGLASADWVWFGQPRFGRRLLRMAYWLSMHGAGC